MNQQEHDALTELANTALELAIRLHINNVDVGVTTPDYANLKRKCEPVLAEIATDGQDTSAALRKLTNQLKQISRQSL